MKLLHVHTMRWLSKGHVMMYFVDILPTFLTLFRYIYFIFYLMFELLGCIRSNMITWNIYFEFSHVWLP